MITAFTTAAVAMNTENYNSLLYSLVVVNSSREMHLDWTRGQ